MKLYCFCCGVPEICGEFRWWMLHQDLKKHILMEKGWFWTRFAGGFDGECYIKILKNLILLEKGWFWTMITILDILGSCFSLQLIAQPSCFFLQSQWSNYHLPSISIFKHLPTSSNIFRHSIFYTIISMSQPKTMFFKASKVGFLFAIAQGNLAKGYGET